HAGACAALVGRGHERARRPIDSNQRPTAPSHPPGGGPGAAAARAHRLPPHPTLREAVRAPRRRRPTGEPPPLPYPLQTSGVGWLIAAGVLIALSVVVFREGLRGPAIAVTVVDDAVVGWLAGSQLPGYVGIMGGWRRSAHGGCSTG